MHHDFFFDQVITLTLGQIFEMTLYCQIIVHSTRLDKRNTMLAKCRAFTKSKVITEKRFSQKKTEFLGVFALWRPNR